jgi:uncharacterized protein (TIGR04255 family)
MSTRLKKPPIFYSLAEIRFNQTLSMGDVIKDIQKKLGADFPDFSQSSAFQIQMKMVVGNAPETYAIALPRWQFVNREGTAGFVIGQNNVVYHTTDYLDSLAFLGSALKGLSVVHECVQLAYVERIGIRTLDAIPCDDFEILKQYVEPGTSGSYGILGGELKQSISQTDISVAKAGTLSTRVAILNGQIGVPQDLAPITLKLKEWVRKINGMHVVLDNDCHLEERLDVDLSAVEEGLRAAKSYTSNAFKKAVTKYAMEMWS